MIMARIIICPKHGRVKGYFCIECKAERYINNVKSGKIEPKVFLEHEPLQKDLLPLQIRFRAYMERKNRPNTTRVYSWEKRSRIVRIIPSKYLEGL